MILLEKIGVYMKKLLILCVAITVGFSCVEAKDYVKTQVREMKHAQKYATTKNVVNNRAQNFDIASVTPTNIKDPHIMKFGDYKNVPDADYNAKLKQDEVKYKEYEKQMSKKHSKYYTTQADTEDFYIVYRVAEKLIRANKLDYRARDGTCTSRTPKTKNSAICKNAKRTGSC